MCSSDCSPHDIPVAEILQNLALNTNHSIMCSSEILVQFNLISPEAISENLGELYTVHTGTFYLTGIFKGINLTSKI